MALAFAFDSYAGRRMKPAERQQISAVDATLRAVEIALTRQQLVRVGIREGRIRVDELMQEAVRGGLAPAKE